MVSAVKTKEKWQSRTVADAFGEYLENIDLSKPFTDEDFSRVLGFAFDALQNG